MKLNRHINKVVIIGSGIMGSRIACHFANIGVDVLLLDIIPSNLTGEQQEDKVMRKPEDMKDSTQQEIGDIVQGAEELYDSIMGAPQ